MVRRQLPIVFGAVVLSFLGVTAFTHLQLRAVDRVSLDIADNAAPSIERLAAARGEMRHLQIALRDHVDRRAAGEPSDAQGIATTRYAMNQAISDYLRLPVFPGEQELWAEILRAKDRLNEAVTACLSQTERGGVQRAEAKGCQEVPAAADALGAVITRDVEFNADHSQALALEIKRLHNRSMYTSLVLDAVCALLALAGALALYRAVRAHAELVERHRRLLEQRASELEQFAGRIAHDILSPLNTVGLALELAERPGDERARARFLARGTRSLARVKRLVLGLLEYARAGAKPDPDTCTDVEPTLADLTTELQTVASEGGTELRVHVDVTSAVRCNAGVLTSLVANLARNAIKYIGDGPARRIEIRAFDRGAAVRFEVEDTGPGLPPGLEEHVFEPYIRGPIANQPGIGLGLATVKRLVEGHGGRVGVRSTPGVGCLFWFELPRAEGEEPISAGTASPGMSMSA